MFVLLITAEVVPCKTCRESGFGHCVHLSPRHATIPIPSWEVPPLVQSLSGKENAYIWLALGRPMPSVAPGLAAGGKGQIFLSAVLTL